MFFKSFLSLNRTLRSTVARSTTGLSRIAPENFVVIHPADAAKFGVETSDVVRVETPEGAFEAPVVVEPTVAPGVLMVPYVIGRHGRRKAEVLRSEGSSSCEVRRRTAEACRDSRRRG